MPRTYRQKKGSDIASVGDFLIAGICVLVVAANIMLARGHSAPLEAWLLTGSDFLLVIMPEGVLAQTSGSGDVGMDDGTAMEGGGGEGPESESDDDAEGGDAEQPDNTTEVGGLKDGSATVGDKSAGIDGVSFTDPGDPGSPSLSDFGPGDFSGFGGGSFGIDSGSFGGDVGGSVSSDSGVGSFGSDFGGIDGVSFTDSGGPSLSDFGVGDFGGFGGGGFGIDSGFSTGFGGSSFSSSGEIGFDPQAGFGVSWSFGSVSTGFDAYDTFLGAAQRMGITPVPGAIDMALGGMRIGAVTNLGSFTGFTSSLALDSMSINPMTNLGSFTGLNAPPSGLITTNEAFFSLTDPAPIATQAFSLSLPSTQGVTPSSVQTISYDKRDLIEMLSNIGQPIGVAGGIGWGINPGTNPKTGFLSQAPAGQSILLDPTIAIYSLGVALTMNQFTPSPYFEAYNNLGALNPNSFTGPLDVPADVVGAIQAVNRGITQEEISSTARTLAVIEVRGLELDLPVEVIGTAKNKALLESMLFGAGNPYSDISKYGMGTIATNPESSVLGFGQYTTGTWYGNAPSILGQATPNRNNSLNQIDVLLGDVNKTFEAWSNNPTLQANQPDFGLFDYVEHHCCGGCIDVNGNVRSAYTAGVTFASDYYNRSDNVAVRNALSGYTSDVASMALAESSSRDLTLSMTDFGSQAAQVETTAPPEQPGSSVAAGPEAPVSSVSKDPASPMTSVAVGDPSVASSPMTPTTPPAQPTQQRSIADILASITDPLVERFGTVQTTKTPESSAPIQSDTPVTSAPKDTTPQSFGTPVESSPQVVGSPVGQPAREEEEDRGLTTTFARGLDAFRDWTGRTYDSIVSTLGSFFGGDSGPGEREDIEGDDLPVLDEDPQTTRFACKIIAVPDHLAKGQTARLAWSVVNGTASLAIINGTLDVPATGFIYIAPRETTVYTLSIGGRDNGGNPAATTCSALVTVAG